MKSAESAALLSIVTPAYREAGNLPVLHGRLCEVMEDLAVSWEWVVVDDHSPDETPLVLEQLARSDRRVRVIRLARNHGAYTAITCGLHHTGGDAVVVLSADLQDPPDVIADLVSRWRAGDQVVWATRRARPGDSAATRVTSGLFHRLLRRLPGLAGLPENGADFFLLDRCAVTALRQCTERSVNLTALVSWLGFRQGYVEYERAARLHGASGWTLGKKITYALDSLTAFSYLPIRLMSCLGVLFALAGFAGALYVLVAAMGGSPVRGYPSLMVVTLTLGGLQMVMLGILGEYLWRAYDEVRGRPRFLIERTVNLESALSRSLPVSEEHQEPEVTSLEPLSIA